MAPRDFLTTCDLICDVRQQRHVASSLDCGGQQSLMRGAVAAGASRNHLATLRYELADLVERLVVYVGRLLHTEETDLSSWTSELARRTFSDW